jgi:hypothetical protein
VKGAVGTPGTEWAEGTDAIAEQHALQVPLATGRCGDDHVERIGDRGRGSQSDRCGGRRCGCGARRGHRGGSGEQTDGCSHPHPAVEPEHVTLNLLGSQAARAAAGPVLCGRFCSAPRRRVTTVPLGGHSPNVLLDGYTWPEERTADRRSRPPGAQGGYHRGAHSAAWRLTSIPPRIVGPMACVGCPSSGQGGGSTRPAKRSAQVTSVVAAAHRQRPPRRPASSVSGTWPES